MNFSKMSVLSASSCIYCYGHHYKSKTDGAAEIQENVHKIKEEKEEKASYA